MNKLYRAFLPIVTFARIDIRRLFRDKVAIFFTFIFPLIFLFVFGGLYGKDASVSFNVALLNQSSSQFASDFVSEAKQNSVLKVDEKVTTIEAAQEKMNQGKLDATIVLPPDFGQVVNEQYPSGQAQVIYTQNNQQAGQTLSLVLEATFKDINSKFVSAPTPFTVRAESTDTKGLTQFDYIFAGLVGFTILTLGVFGPTSVFPRLKEQGVLRRYHTTTLKVWQYFTGNVLSNAAVGLMSITTMFIAATLVFHLRMRGDYLSLLAVLILGVTLLFGIGLAIGGWAKNESQAAPLANLITFPMMFLSGVFFPTFLMPEWLQSITKFIPLTAVIDSTRMVITEGKTIFELGPQLAVMGVWFIIIYFIAFRVFRWE